MLSGQSRVPDHWLLNNLDTDAIEDARQTNIPE